jgi:hypothetical protein
VHGTTAVIRLARAYRSLTVLRGLTVINNDVIVGVGRGTVKGCVGAVLASTGQRIANLIRPTSILQRKNVIVTHDIVIPLQRG